MTEEIRSKIFNYGNEKESSWPPRFGKGGAGRFHLDKTTGELKEGNPPPEFEKFGTAPIAIMDSMPKTYHEAAGREVESRQEWERLDKEHNTLTFGSMEEPKRHTEKGVTRERLEMKKDRRNSALTAMQAYRENPEEIRQKREKEGEKQMQVLKKAGLTEQLKEQGVKV